MEETAPVEEAVPEEATAEEETAPVEETAAEEEKAESTDVEIALVASEEEVPKKNKADWSGNRRSNISKIMKAKKISDRIPLGENIYSLFIVSPTYSWPFIFCCGVYFIKIAILLILLSDINFLKERNDILNQETKVTVVKYCLIPVAVAMQEDMMHSFFFFANVIYCPDVLKVSKVATKDRFMYSYFLRTIDGILSLFSNYFIMLITTDTLGVFLNFAALQFLYSIDDIFYELVTQGFFGENLEKYSQICKQITMRRRLGEDNKTIFGCLRISWMDTFLFCFSLVICYVIYALVSTSYGSDDSNLINILPSEAPSIMATSVTTFFNTTDDDGF